MKYLFGLWAGPLVIFWGWFYLSLHDMNFGFVILTRQVHDLVFQLYGNLLGIEPQIIPPMVARACVFDGLVICAIWAFRRRRELSAWARGVYISYTATNSEPNALGADQSPEGPAANV